LDHVISFFYLDGRIWFRHYQVIEIPAAGDKSAESQLVEIGPRFVLTPVRIFSDSLSGATLWESQTYVSPNELRRSASLQAQGSYKHRVHSRISKQRREGGLRREADPLDTMFK